MKRAAPYFKKSHKAWYVNVKGKPVRLGNDQEAALKAYLNIIATNEPVNDSSTVEALKARFLASHAKSAPATLAFYTFALDSFTAYLGPCRVSDVTIAKVNEWINSKVGISATYKHNLGQAVRAMFSWAGTEGVKSPVVKMKLASVTPRTDYVNPQQFEELLEEAHHRKDKCVLLDILTVMRETGCRPKEARCVERRHFQVEDMCWMFPASESKGGKKRRVVNLSPKAFEICMRLSAKNPTGPMFRTSTGSAWTRNNLTAAVVAIVRARNAKHEDQISFTPYTTRHVFATDAILRGVDLITIANLMGHSNLTMLQQVYNHINKCSDHMRNGLRKALGLNSGFVTLLPVNTEESVPVVS